MKRLFISQPMRGVSEEEILRKRKKAVETAEEMLECKVEVIDSYFEDYDPENGCIPLKYLAKSIELLADADVAIFCEGWSFARGCIIENQCAREYGIPVIECHDFGSEWEATYKKTITREFVCEPAI